MSAARKPGGAHFFGGALRKLNVYILKLVWK
jgi:hypothetical protein